MANVYKIKSLETCSEYYAWWDNIFTDEELLSLKNIALYGKDRGVVGNTGDENKVVRRTKIHWQSPNKDNEWLYTKLSHVISELNRDYFRFDLSEISEPLQFCNYESKEKGHYDWHTDKTANRQTRKLSLVLQLSNPDDYEGGDLCLKTSPEDIVIKKKAGFITVFPSWTLHRVTPVTKGSRQSLVAWVSGPPFR